MKFNVGEEVSVMYRGELCKAIINGVDTSLARKGGEVRYILRIPNRGYSIVVESEIRSVAIDSTIVYKVR